MNRLLMSLLIPALSACGMSQPPLRAELPALQLKQAPAPLQKDHFKGDESHVVSEQALARILDAPVFLERGARVGVLPVANGYKVDRDLPLAGVPDEVSSAMQRSALFEVTTEISTDWPADSGVPGLRELAARYRCEYLLLYRHRFVDRSWVNGYGALIPTVIGPLFAPIHTLETAGILEATLFDVRTGTLLFTVYERVSERVDENVWQNDRKRRELKERLVGEAATKLADRVLGKTRRLAAARPPVPSQRDAKRTLGRPASGETVNSVESDSTRRGATSASEAQKLGPFSRSMTMTESSKSRSMKRAK